MMAKVIRRGDDSLHQLADRIMPANQPKYPTISHLIRLKIFCQDMPTLNKKETKTQDNQLKYWLALSQIQQIGPIKFQKILNYFKNLEAAWQANAADLINAGLEEKLAQEIIIHKSQINPDEELSKLEKEQVKVTLITDGEYPKLLKEIYSPPPLLYYRGNLTCLNEFCLAVVGTRKYSSYGQQAAREIVSVLAQNGITIVSGLALGIDALAHQACLNVQGQTAAVLGSGIDWQNIYPSSNRHLAQKIIENSGCLISEYPLGTGPAKFTFPVRNRIISGLAIGTLVIEAPESSGALITAKHALEQNREVFALPGSIYHKNSVGANNLIKQGAKMVTSAQDILEELNLQAATQFIVNQKLIPDSREEEIILKILTKEPLHIDKIAEFSKLKINVLSGLLVIMEMKGMVRDLGGKNYVLAR